MKNVKRMLIIACVTMMVLFIRTPARCTAINNEKMPSLSSEVCFQSENGSFFLIMYPESGTYYVGEMMLIEWKNPQISSVDIYLQGILGNTNSTTLIAAGAYDNGTYPWTISQNVMINGTYQIIMYVNGNHSEYGTSARFVILQFPNYDAFDNGLVIGIGVVLLIVAAVVGIATLPKYIQEKIEDARAKKKNKA